MPSTSTIAEGFKELLKRFKISLTELSRRTGITKARLIQLFEAGDFTQAELACIAATLQPGFALAFLRSHQTDNFNQAGAGHRQHITINQNTYNVVIQVMTACEPDTTALGDSPEQREVYHHLPGGQVPLHQVTAYRRPMRPGVSRE